MKKGGYSFNPIGRHTKPGRVSVANYAEGVTIAAKNRAGMFYGIQTFLQLVRNGGRDLACCEIEDAPRYDWRGYMLDESRHFFGKEKVKQLLDWMAYYKLNKFHWHLTDEPGWRIEIKKYPRLATVGEKGIGVTRIVRMSVFIPRMKSGRLWLMLPGGTLRLFRK